MTADKKFVEKGEKIYRKIRTQLKKKFGPDKFVSIDVDSGDYFVGKTSSESLEKAIKKYPDRQFFLAGVGRMAGYML